ncbi:MAG: ABC transporter substrate-binding protein [Thermoguttaceae bacterium]|nr:ABC transporter substrate-binding protein [Thermoguttaceae bacterium]
MFLINQSDDIKNVSSFLKNRRFSRRRFLFLKLNFCFLVALLALVPVTGCSDKNINQANTTRHPSNEIPQRIISTVPSITETLFALDLQNRLVGVSDFCHYPPEADKIRKVGGYFDPNLEAMLELEPDLVLILKENQDLRRRLESLGINVLTVDHSSITGILESFEQIGAVFGDDFQAKDIKFERIWKTVFKKSGPPPAIRPIDLQS